MADTLPADMTPMALTEARPTGSQYSPSPEELVRQAAALDRLAQSAAARKLSPEEYAMAGGHATDEHWLLDLDANSAFTLPGACCRSYLTAGGQSCA